MAIKYSPKIVTNNLILHIDAANTKSYKPYPVKNIAVPINEWTFKRSDLTVISGGMEPPIPGANIFKMQINTASYVNTLHRKVDVTNMNSPFGEGYLRYSLYARGDALNSTSASIQIDISDGKTSGWIPVHTSSAWQRIDVWDNTSGNYNAQRFYDIFLDGADGDIIYASAIVLARSATDYTASQRPLTVDPGFMDYGESRNITIKNLAGSNTVSIGSCNFINDSIKHWTFSGVDSQSNHLNISSSVRLKNDYTVRMVFKSHITSSNTEYMRIVGGTGWMKLEWYNRLLSYNTASANYGFLYPIVPAFSLAKNWNDMHISVDSNNIMRIYNNGVLCTPTASITGELLINKIGHSTIATTSSSIAIFSIYNKCLSDSDVVQNFNVTRKRFNL